VNLRPHAIFLFNLIIIKLIIIISELQLGYLLLILQLDRALAPMRLLLLVILVRCGDSIIVVALTTRFLQAVVRDGGERLVIICDWGRSLYRRFVQ
jgi:hypothetical protein